MQLQQEDANSPLRKQVQQKYEEAEAEYIALLRESAIDADTILNARTRSLTDEQSTRREEFQAELGLSKEQMLASPRDITKGITSRYTDETLNAIKAWAEHYGAEGASRMTRWIMLSWLRQKGKPPGWKGRWDPDDLL